MTDPIIKLSDNAANKIKEIMSGAQKESIGVRIGVKAGGCAGMSYIMEYAKNLNPNDEVIEDKGVKVFIDAGAVMYLLGTERTIKLRNFPHHLYLKIPTKLRDVDVGSPSKSSISLVHICIASNAYLCYL